MLVAAFTYSRHLLGNVDCHVYRASEGGGAIRNAPSLVDLLSLSSDAPLGFYYKSNAVARSQVVYCAPRADA
jgi:hypothetical protein